MGIITKHIKTIERIDQLTRLQATGSPEQLAYRLGISKTKLYRIIDLMKELNAPISYDVSIQSYVYIKEVGFKFGFYLKEQNLNTRPHITSVL
ncbi:hypothetical protein ATE84_5188 [Aquimarina sp. MAR_2010_214]|uniref:DNA-binding protein n=1 Tax=Aquimarina sp. MAR_2010_214 TaxID=1250026 RepID=UPI000CA84C30|nr:DNA-binding protein [Aquimarina sp. MAR_2010_214]PKV53054.1 hypothetical protein ATE84_5188 [Aquimarina sp. MAR_2010_214]